MTYRVFTLSFGILFVVLGFVACANRAELADLDEEEIRRVDDRELCEAYYYGQADNVRYEINRRGLIPEARWSAVDAQKTSPGMRECAIYASLGTPDRIAAKTGTEKSKVFYYEKNDLTVRIFYENNRVSKIERNEK